MLGQIAADYYHVARFYRGGGERAAFGYQAHAGSVDEYPVGLALLHHLGVAGDYFHPGFFGRLPHGGDQAPEQGGGKAFLQDEAGGKRRRHGALNGEVVDRAADRHAADVRAGEFHRGDHVGIGSEGQARSAQGQFGGVLERGERRVGEAFKENLFHQVAAQAAAAAVPQEHFGEFRHGQHLPAGIFLGASKMPMKLFAEGLSLRERL